MIDVMSLKVGDRFVLGGNNHTEYEVLFNTMKMIFCEDKDEVYGFTYHMKRDHEQWDKPDATVVYRSTQSDFPRLIKRTRDLLEQLSSDGFYLALEMSYLLKDIPEFEANWPLFSASSDSFYEAHRKMVSIKRDEVTDE